MTDFTPEQEAEIQKRVDAARQEQMRIEQYRLAGDQFYRTALTILAERAQSGAVDPFVLEVGKNQYSVFLAQFFPKAEQQKPEEKGAADEPVED